MLNKRSHSQKTTYYMILFIWLPRWLSGKESIQLPMQEMQVWSLGQEDPLEEEMTTHLQNSCLEYSIDKGAWWAAVHGVAKELDMT